MSAARWAADLLTVSRMAASILLVRTPPLSAAFYGVYTFAGATDLLDGPVARLTHSAGPAGARLDSLADLIFLLAALWTLGPELAVRLPGWSWAALAAVAALRLAAYGAGAVRFHRFIAYHTWSNKAAGLALFLSPYALGRVESGLLCGALFLLCGAAAAEELALALRSKQYDPDLPGIWAAGRN